MSNEAERLQKVLAQLGYGSRRELEQWIQNGRIRVNGKIAELGVKVSRADRIFVDGKKVDWRAEEPLKARVMLYNKPEGQICSKNDPEHDNSVFDHLPKIRRGRWINIGRLDINTSGLLMFTNHGELAHRLMHPKYEIEREYAVRILGEVSQKSLKELKQGVVLDDGLAKFDHIKFVGGEGSNSWYHVVLKEGRNREVRRLWESVDGIQVSRLIRVRFGDVTLPRELRRGKFKEMDYADVKNVAKLVGLKLTAPKRATPTRRR